MKRFPVLLLAATVVLFAIGAERALDLTDESYYILNFRYWRAPLITTTLFGAYFDIPFRLMGESIFSIRIFGIILLLLSGGFFFNALFNLNQTFHDVSAPKCIRNTFIATGMSASLTYYTFGSTLRIPSYNLLTLACMLTATGILFTILRNPTGTAYRSALPVLYGFIVSICAFSKITSGAMLVVLHLTLYFSLAGVRRQNFLTLITSIIAGSLLNAALIQLASPSWFPQFMRATELTFLMEKRDLLGAFTAFRWDIQKEIISAWPWYLPSAAMSATLIIFQHRLRPYHKSLLTAMACTHFSIFMVLSTAKGAWYPALVFLAFTLGCLDFVSQPENTKRRDTRNILLLATFFFATPIALSWGTNTMIIQHSKMASAFPLSAILLFLLRLRAKQSISTIAYFVSASLLCLPALASQIKPWIDVTYTYRQPEPLAAQDVSTPRIAGNHGLYLGQTLHDDLTRFTSTLAMAGFTKDTPMLDLTGDSPGLVMIAEGRPLGLAWLTGGYPGTESVFASLLAMLDPAELKQAWIISSPDNYRSVPHWELSMKNRLGGVFHEKIGSIRLTKTYKENEGAAQAITLDIWRPLSR